MTTRAQRPGEVDGADYFFRTRAEFEGIDPSHDVRVCRVCTTTTVFFTYVNEP